MTASVDTTTAQAAPPKNRRGRWARPALSLLLPIGLAVFWEVAVRMGLSNGRLVPPPSVIFNTFLDLWRSGELQDHALATTCGASPPAFCFGVAAGTVLGALAGYSGLLHRLVDPTLQAIALDPLDRMGAPVHSLVRYFRSLQDHSDRCRRVLSGLSRRHGRCGVGRSQDRRSRSRVSPLGLRDDPSHPAARRVPGLRDLAARRVSDLAGCSWSQPSSWAPLRAWVSC